jgi:hypothetical protein
LFEKHCSVGGLARTGSKQRFQAMTDTVHEAVIDWLDKHPDATPEEKIRLDLGYLIHQVLLLVFCRDLAVISACMGFCSYTFHLSCSRSFWRL